MSFTGTGRRTSRDAWSQRHRDRRRPPAARDAQAKGAELDTFLAPGQYCELPP